MRTAPPCVLDHDVSVSSPSMLGKTPRCVTVVAGSKPAEWLTHLIISPTELYQSLHSSFFFFTLNGCHSGGNKEKTHKYNVVFIWFFLKMTSVNVVVVVVSGPKEAKGHTGSLLINSNTGSMLFSADGNQTVIGPDKLRVTGTWK